MLRTSNWKKYPEGDFRVKLPKMSELPPPIVRLTLFMKPFIILNHLSGFKHSQGTWGALGMQTKKNNQTPSPLGQATIFVWEKMLGEKKHPNGSREYCSHHGF